jgi:hypothetical protein
MNTVLLRTARRSSDGARYWRVPGAPNKAVLLPPSLSMWPGAASFTWPWQNAKGDWVQCTVRLDWHRDIAKAAVRGILAKCT